jgi:hypothetical protein
MMPCVSRFHGIVIYLYADDHNPPHFHAKCGGQDVAVAIGGGEVLFGRLPIHAMRMVREWSALHRDELMLNWDRLQSGQLPVLIEPLP